MKAFRYTAFTGDGRRKSGTVLAETEFEATQQLTAQGLFPSDIALKQSAKSHRLGRLSPEIQMVFTRQMAVMLSADLTAEQALEALRTSAGGAKLEHFTARAKSALLDGQPLSEALEIAGGGFPPYFTAAVRAGEISGDAGAVFTELANHLEQSGTDKAQIATALIYPAFVAVVAVLVCAILMTTVAPEIIGMFEMTGRPLPQLTQVVLDISDWFGRNWQGLSAVLAAVIVGGAAGMRTDAGQGVYHRIILSLPFVGGLIKQGAAAQYMRTLALVIGSRQAVADAVESASDVLTIQQHKDQAEQVGQGIRQGETLSEALQHLSIIPPVARQLINAGERSARLAPMMARAADLVENSLIHSRKRFAALLEPALMIVVGAFVLMIVLAVLLPVFDLQAAVTI